MALFEINALLHKAPAAASDASLLGGTSNPVMVLCKSPDKLNELVGLMGKHEDLHYVSKGDWSMHDLVNVLMPVVGPAEIWMSTYSITEFPMRQLAILQQNGQLKGLHMLLDYKAKVRYPAVFQLAENVANRIRLTPCHAKVTILLGTNAQLAIITSSNWTTNKRIETGIITKQPAIIQFHKQWIDKAITDGAIFE